MKLHQLFSYFRPQTSDQELLEREVSSLCFDARQALPGSVFVAVRGTEADGHSFITQAIEKGAIALVVEKAGLVPESYTGLVLEVPDSRQILDLLAARFYGFPSQDLFCFGVTGTNGKTSVTYILEHILNYHHKPTAVMGTVNHRLGEKIWPAGMTTPDPVTLQGRLREFKDQGAVAVALEVSSHALEQKRAHSVHFNTAIFTNLTLDHLDYHKDMKSYFAAKQKLFTDLMWLTLKRPKFAVVNTDDAYGRRLKVAEDVIAWTYGQKESDFRFRILSMNFSETEFELKTVVETHQVALPVTGEHSIYNVVAAAAAAMSFGISLEQSFQALKTFPGVPGRLQKVSSNSEKTVFVDYAHTPDALENVLNSLRKIREASGKDSRIITVFGCGGDRDKTKRPLMGEIAARLSDAVIVTSDNPRTENAQAILDDIKKGVPEGKAEYEINREAAIEKAIRLARPGDVVLIAGKGHEDYQILGTEKISFSDFLVAQKYL